MKPEALDGMIDAALEIAHRNADSRSPMKNCILAGDLKGALLWSCELVGLEPTPNILALEKLGVRP